MLILLGTGKLVVALALVGSVGCAKGRQAPAAEAVTRSNVAVEIEGDPLYVGVRERGCLLDGEAKDCLNVELFKGVAVLPERHRGLSAAELEFVVRGYEYECVSDAEATANEVLDQWDVVPNECRGPVPAPPGRFSPDEPCPETHIEVEEREAGAERPPKMSTTSRAECETGKKIPDLDEEIELGRELAE